MGSQQYFCLKWNNHQNNILAVFDDLLQNEELVDVTLACDGDMLKAHKVVLSACSPYFQILFKQNPCKHPIVILKDIQFTDIQALVNFMYKGEVNVSQRQMTTLLKTAEILKVKGLTEIIENAKKRPSTPQQPLQQQAPLSSASLAAPAASSRQFEAAEEQATSHSCSSPSVPPTRKRKRRYRRRSSGSIVDQSDDEGGVASEQMPLNIEEFVAPVYIKTEMASDSDNEFQTNDDINDESMHYHSRNELMGFGQCGSSVGLSAEQEHSQMAGSDFGSQHSSKSSIKDNEQVLGDDLWALLHSEAEIYVPSNLKLILKATEYDNLYSLANFQDKDKLKIEFFMQHTLHLLIDEEDRKQYYDIFEKCPEKFQFVAGQEKVLTTIVSRSKKIMKKKLSLSSTLTSSTPKRFCGKKPSLEPATGDVNDTIVSLRSALEGNLNEYVKKNLACLLTEQEEAELIHIEANVSRDGENSFIAYVSCPFPSCDKETKVSRIDNSRWNPSNFYSHVKTHFGISKKKSKSAAAIANAAIANAIIASTASASVGNAAAGNSNVSNVGNSIAGNANIENASAGIFQVQNAGNPKVEIASAGNSNVENVTSEETITGC